KNPRAGYGSDRKEVQGMTRKRFVKLLMAERFDRNEANLWADYYNTEGVSYVDAYKEMEAYRAVHVIAERVDRPFKNFQCRVLELYNKAFLLLVDVAFLLLADVSYEARKSYS